jgi:hypothetical protein
MCLLRIGVNEGDEIAIVSGAPTPFVLRRTSAANKYTLESDAYLRAVCVGKLCKKRAIILLRSIVCEIVLGSSVSHNPLICNIKDSEDMRKEREKKSGSRAQQISEKVWTAAQIYYLHTD